MGGLAMLAIATWPLWRHLVSSPATTASLPATAFPSAPTSIKHLEDTYPADAPFSASAQTSTASDGLRIAERPRILSVAESGEYDVRVTANRPIREPEAELILSELEQGYKVRIASEATLELTADADTSPREVLTSIEVAFSRVAEEAETRQRQAEKLAQREQQLDSQIREWWDTTYNATAGDVPYTPKRPDFPSYPSLDRAPGKLPASPYGPQSPGPIFVSQHPTVTEIDGKRYLRLPLDKRPTRSWFNHFCEAYAAGPAPGRPRLYVGWLLCIPLDSFDVDLDRMVDDVLDAMDEANKVLAESQT